MTKTQNFTELDYEKLVRDYPNYPFYSKGGGGEWDIFDEKTEKKVGHWSSSKKRLTVNSPKLTKWLKENSYYYMENEVGVWVD